MKIMLQQLRSWDPWEVRQCVGDRGLGLHIDAATVATPGWLAEVLLVGGAGMGRLDLYKVDKALRDVTVSWAWLEIGLVGGFKGPLLVDLQFTGCPTQEGVSLP